ADGGKPGGGQGGADAKGGADGGKTGTGADGQAGKDGAKDAPPAAGDVAVTLQDQGGNPASGVSWEVTMPDGTKKTGSTGSDGKVSVTGGTQSGSYKLVLPSLDKGGTSGGDTGGGTTPGG